MSVSGRKPGLHASWSDWIGPSLRRPLRRAIPQPHQHGAGEHHQQQQHNGLGHAFPHLVPLEGILQRHDLQVGGRVVRSPHRGRVDHVEDPQRVHRPEGDGKQDERGQQRQRDIAQRGERAGTVDPGRLVRFGGQRLQRTQQDQGDEWQIAPGIDNQDRDDGPLRGAEPVDRIDAEKRQHMVQNAGIRRCHHDLPHQRADHRRHHQRQQHQRAHHLAPRDACVQEERHREPEPHLNHDRRQRESECELKRAGEQRLAEQVDVVVEPDKAEAFGILQPVVGEAVVHSQAERVHHPDQQNQGRRQQQVRQRRLLPPEPAPSCRCHPQSAVTA